MIWGAKWRLAEDCGLASCCWWSGSSTTGNSSSLQAHAGSKSWQPAMLAVAAPGTVYLDIYPRQRDYRMNKKEY